MPDNQTPEMWEKLHQLYGNGMTFGLKTSKGTYPMPEWVIDRIIADHRAAQQRDAAVEALEALFNDDYDHDLETLKYGEKAACGCYWAPDCGMEYNCPNHGPSAFIERALARIEALGKEDVSK